MVAATALAQTKHAVAEQQHGTSSQTPPADWRVMPVEQFASVATGGRNTQDRVDDGLYPFYVRSQIVERINTFSFDGEAVLTAGDGVGTGKIFHYINGKCDIHQRVYRISDFTPDVNGYYFFLFFRAHFHSRIMQMTAKSSVDSVRREMITRMPIWLPPRFEQDAIAEAVRDAEGLVVTLSTAIDKKRAIALAAAQSYLTGERRLPGFAKEWCWRPLGEVCAQIVDGTHFTPSYVESGVPFYSVENVTADDFENTRFISIEEHRQLVRRCKPERGDILLTRIGAIGDAKLIDWDVNASIYVSLALLKCGTDIRSDFLAAYMKSARFRKDIEDRSLLNAAPRKINMGEIGKVRVPVPEHDEQKEIAEFLGVLTAELQSLSAQLEKISRLRIGMTQDLLAGRARLS